MRLYANLKNVNFSYSVDCVYFETEDGVSICLDFDEHDYYKPSAYVSSFRLKSASVSIDGEESQISDNDVELFRMLKKSKLSELVVYADGIQQSKCRRIKVQTLKIETPNGELFFKTNKCIVV